MSEANTHESLKETLAVTAAACTKHIQDLLAKANRDAAQAQQDSFQYAGAIEGIKFLEEELSRALATAPATAPATPAAAEQSKVPDAPAGA